GRYHIGFHPPRSDLLSYAHRLFAQEIDVPPDQAVHRRSSPAVRHRRRFDAQGLVKEQASHMRRCPDPTVGLSYLIAVLLKIGHKLAEIVCRKIFPGYDHGRCMGGWADRFEVTLGVILNVRSKHRCSDMRPHAPSEQGIAVWLRGSDSRATQCAASATDILDDYLLAQGPAHMLRHNTRHDITRAASRERDHRRD